MALTDPVLAGMQPFNVLQYQLSQDYDAHYDVFDPESYGPQSSQREDPPAQAALATLTCKPEQTLLPCLQWQ